MATLLAALATFGAGFVLRPFGAIVFGRLGDTHGRKSAFLATMVLMGGATAAIGLLPTYSTAGWVAPALLVLLRLIQGLAIGGEFGGAVTYVAEHSPPGRKGFYTSWLQTTGTIGLLLSLGVIMVLRTFLTEEQFAAWGWRVPFLLSLILLAFSLAIRMRLGESPAFVEMRASGTVSRQPLRDTFGNPKVRSAVLIAIFGMVAGQAVIWYMGHFYSLQFLSATLKLDHKLASTYLACALVLATPFFVIFGWLSDKVGRLPLMMLGCVLSAALFIPVFKGLEHFGNPALEAFRATHVVQLAGNDCSLTPSTQGPTQCALARSYLTSLAVPVQVIDSSSSLQIISGDDVLEGFRKPELNKLLQNQGLPMSAESTQVNGVAVVLLLMALVLMAALVYGPLGAHLTEQFPVHVRYSAVSVSLQFGNGWIGGFGPFIATALVSSSGDVYQGLWYPIGVSVLAVVVTIFSVKPVSKY
jgi:MFS family permease